MEITELPLSEHPFFFGCQFHPEFKSGPLRPSPPFQGLIKAASGLLYAEKEFIKQFGNVKQIHPQRKFNVPKAKNEKSTSIITDLLHTFDKEMQIID